MHFLVVHIERKVLQNKYVNTIHAFCPPPETIVTFIARMKQKKTIPNLLFIFITYSFVKRGTPPIKYFH